MRNYTILKMKAIILLTIIFSIQSCGIFIPQKQSWEFIQSVGGIKIDSIIQKGDTYLMYSNINVSGTDSITAKPQKLNSGISCSKIYATIDNSTSKIFLQVGIRASGFGCSY
jgi:hypothetical protein